MNEIHIGMFPYAAKQTSEIVSKEHYNVSENVKKLNRVTESIQVLPEQPHFPITQFVPGMYFNSPRKWQRPPLPVSKHVRKRVGNLSKLS